MKLSMYLLEDWFRSKGYKIQSAIHEGEPCLVGTRIADELSQKALACISDKDADFGLVTVTNGEDVIFVVNATGSEIFNAANEAFEYYNAWEASLLRSAFQGASLQDLLDEAHLAIMRPMLIKNSRMELVALTDSYGPQTHPLWADYLRQFRPGRSHRYNIGHAFNEPVEVAEQREPQIAYSPLYQGDFMYANLWTDTGDRRIGYISAYQYNRPFGKKDLQLMSVFQKIVNFYVNAKPDVLFFQSALEEYMQGALHGSSRYHTRDIYQLNNWKDEDHFAVIVLYDRDGGNRSSRDMREIDAAQDQLEANMSPMQALVEPDRIVFLVNLREYGPYSKLVGDLRQYADAGQFVWGVSHEFTGLENFAEEAELADLAAGRARSQGLPGATLREAAVPLLMEHLHTAPHLDKLLHPDYQYLRQLDESGGTQFAQTLFWYLYDNRSFMDASVHMGVHRNTINYRITKIFECLGEDNFDSPQNRLLYLLTYLLEHPNLK